MTDLKRLLGMVLITSYVALLWVMPACSFLLLLTRQVPHKDRATHTFSRLKSSLMDMGLSGAGGSLLLIAGVEGKGSGEKKKKQLECFCL